MSWSRTHRASIELAGLWILIPAFVLEIVWHFAFNWSFSKGEDMFLLLLLFGTLFNIVILFWWDNSRARPHPGFWPAALIVMGLYASTSFLVSMNEYTDEKRAGKTPIENNEILIDRKSGEFVARLPINKSDKLLTWDKRIINHFKYKIVPGIPAQGEFKEVVMVKSGSWACELPVMINYEINSKDAYETARKKWKNSAAMQEAIDRTFNDIIDTAVVPKINRRFDILVRSVQGKVNVADFLFSRNKDKAIRDKIEAELLKYFAGELGIIIPKTLNLPLTIEVISAKASPEQKRYSVSEALQLGL